MEFESIFIIAIVSAITIVKVTKIVFEKKETNVYDSQCESYRASSAAEIEKIKADAAVEIAKHQKVCAKCGGSLQ